MKAYKKPVLKDYSGDLSRKWHIYFSVYEPESGKMIPIKKYEGLNDGNDLQLRYIIGENKLLN
jgi:hypothetical protein